ncbi:MAG: hypothetical protein AABW82_03185 [Nanoarchaeota archaeon]
MDRDGQEKFRKAFEARLKKDSQNRSVNDVLKTFNSGRTVGMISCDLLAEKLGKDDNGLDVLTAYKDGLAFRTQVPLSERIGQDYFYLVRRNSEDSFYTLGRVRVLNDSSGYKNEPKVSRNNI